MPDRQRAWIWFAAALSFIVGLIFVLIGSSAGWIFFILGLSYLALSTRAGSSWAASNPSLVRWGLIAVTLLLVLLVIVVAAVFLLK